jgi:hypothetical protein
MLERQKSEFFEEVYFRRRLQFGFKDGGRVIVPVLLEFTAQYIFWVSSYDTVTILYV